jgi:hypothetical protein
MAEHPSVLAQLTLELRAWSCLTLDFERRPCQRSLVRPEVTYGLIEICRIRPDHSADPLADLRKLDLELHENGRKLIACHMMLYMHNVNFLRNLRTPTLTLAHLAEPMLEKCSQQLPDLSPDTKISPRSKHLGSCCFGGSTRCSLKIVPIMYFSSVIARLDPGQALAPWPKGVQFRYISSVASSQRRGCHDSGSGYTDASLPWS